MSRRRFLRHPVKVPLYISVKGGVFQRFIDLESKNLSEGGLAFETGKRIPLEANSRVEVSVVEGLSPAARIEGRVVYRQKHPDSGRYTIGVAFERFVNVEREELLRLFEGGEDEQRTPQATPTPA
jgi:c-di-GMP-binding flagellar brake protein YcgR